MKYSVYAAVVGSKFIGEFEANSKEEAIALAEVSDAAWPMLCHQCSDQCSDPACTDFIAEEETEVSTGE